MGCNCQSSDDDIAVGDIVVLASGGPDMTVVDISQVYADCAWFDGKELVSAELPYDALEVVAKLRTTVERVLH